MSMESANERELLTAAAQGSRAAYRELIHLHQAAVYRFAWAMAGEEDAQAVTESAFLTAWRQLEFFPELHMSFRTRLLQLVCLECSERAGKGRLRRAIAAQRGDEDAQDFPAPPLRYDPRTNMEHIALQADIEDALHTLPLRLRQIILLHEMGGVADAQIADFLGDTAQAVRADLLRARALMRRQILTAGGFFPAEEGAPRAEGPQLAACKNYIPTLSAAADGLCTAEEKQALAAHMAQCPGCQGYYGALSAIHHGLSVMKHEVPGDMAQYILHCIHQEAGPAGAPEDDAPKEARWHFRPVVGRFTIIGLCIALVLLAYSGGILERAETNLPLSHGGQSQTEQSLSQTSPEETVQAPEDAQSGDIEDSTADGETQPETAPDTSEENSSGEEDTQAEPDSGSITPGGAVSDTLIPSGETYAAVYTADSAAAAVLELYSTASFSATLTDGTQANYYVLPTADQEAAEEALTAAGASYAPYTEAPDALSDSAERILFIVLS